MSWNNKVVWSEGMFLRPQHFQQHDRWLQALLEGRCAPLRTYPWGFRTLELDTELLALGKVGLAAASGVFADGTPFSLPADQEPPPPLEVPEGSRDTRVVLALPTRRQGSPETAPPHIGDAEPRRTETTADYTQSARGRGLTRYLPEETLVRNDNAGADSGADLETALEVGTLNLRLALASEDLSAYTVLGAAQVIERRADATVVLADNFLPPCLDCRAAPPLAGFVAELQGLLHHRGEALAARLGGTGQGGVAEIADFLWLQVINRFTPLFAHLTTVDRLHPEDFYRIALQLAGELATFAKPGRRPVDFPTYRHDALRESFAPLMQDLRQSLSMVIEQNAIAIPLEERQYGIRLAVIHDPKLLEDASLVLAVNAQVAGDMLRSRFPRQVKIGAPSQIRDLVNRALPGIGLQVLPVAPRQIPYHAGFSYFELDRHSEHWKAMVNSGGLAMHIAGQFPGIELELWAIRGVT